MAEDKKEVTVRDLQECLYALEEWLRVVRGAMDSLDPDTKVGAEEPDAGIAKIIRGLGRC